LFAISRNIMPLAGRKIWLLIPSKLKYMDALVRFCISNALDGYSNAVPMPIKVLDMLP